MFPTAIVDLLAYRTRLWVVRASTYRAKRLFQPVALSTHSLAHVPEVAKGWVKLMHSLLSTFRWSVEIPWTDPRHHRHREHFCAGAHGGFGLERGSEGIAASRDGERLVVECRERDLEVAVVPRHLDLLDGLLLLLSRAVLQVVKVVTVYPTSQIGECLYLRTLRGIYLFPLPFSGGHIPRPSINSTAPLLSSFGRISSTSRETSLLVASYALRYSHLYLVPPHISKIVVVMKHRPLFLNKMRQSVFIGMDIIMTALVYMHHINRARVL